MWYKQQVQFALFPRILKGIRIGYKGEYSLQFELVHESDQGTITSAYPYIFKVPQSQPQQKTTKAASRPPERTGKTRIENNCGYFQTSIFNVNYESHVQYFTQLCIFKLEYKMKKNGRGKTQLYVHLLSHRKIISEVESEPNKLEIKCVTSKLHTRKININMNLASGSQPKNRNNSAFNCTFMEVQLQDNDFFGSLFLYLGSVPLGWRIRDNKMTLCHFLCQEAEQKQKFMQRQKKYLTTETQVGKCIKDLTKQSAWDVKQFYELTVKSSVAVLSEVKKTYRQLVESTKSSSILLQPVMTQLIPGEDQSGLESLEKISSNQEYIQEYFGCQNLNALYFEIHQENAMICENVRSAWQSLVALVQNMSIYEFELCCATHIDQISQRWRLNCIRFFESKAVVDDMSRMSTNSILGEKWLHSKTTKNLHKAMLDSGHKWHKFDEAIHVRDLMAIRQAQISRFKAWRKQQIEKQATYLDEDYSHPLLMVENFKCPKKNRQIKPGHAGLVVFVHGFKGSQYDLERASQYLLKHNENVEVLRIKTVENDVDYSIDQMAVVVAAEIKRYILCSFLKIDSISIVGYSLGGIVSRAALPHLEQFKQKMNIFVTFSSPHLGTIATNNSLVKFGIWYLTKLNKCTVLEELHTCCDLNTSTKSYMKMLSEQSHISWFHKVVLVSCQEDEFVPHASSRVDDNQHHYIGSEKSFKTSLKSPRRIEFEESEMDKYRSEMMEMSENLRRSAKKIQRVEVWFDNENKNNTFDRLTGRQSHIEFLDNCHFLKWFFQLYGPQL